MSDAPILPPRHSRFWLFAPYVVLALVVLGWSAAWVVIRSRTDEALDRWIAAEAAAGRQWTCQNRAIGGYPFRIEVTCDSLTLQRPDVRLSVGRVTAVAQVYQPRHVIAEIAGPLRATDGRVTVDGTWRLLEASFHAAPEGFQRASLVMDAPAFRVAGLAPGDVEVSGRHLETHLRPNPTRGAGEGAYDGSLQVASAAIPFLDELLGGREPTDLDLALTVTRMGDVAARPVPEELERWRRAGGTVDVAALTLRKGNRQLAGKGQFGIDEVHRPQGRADISAQGIEGLLGSVMGGRVGAAGGLLGALLGGAAGATPPAPASGGQGTAPGLKPLPPLRLEDGRLFIGPFPIPGVRIAPLY